MFSLFKKKNKIDVPVWADFFTPEEYAAFSDAIENYVRSKNTEFKLIDGVLYLPDENGEQEFGLTNVAQVCKQHGIKEYAQLIKNHFMVMDRTAKFQKEFDSIVGDFEKAKEYVGVRLYDGLYVNSAGPGNTISKSIVGNIHAMLIFDLPDAVMNIKPDQTKPWNLPIDELFEIGINNIRKKYKTDFTKHELGGQEVIFGTADHFFVGNTLFDLPTNRNLVGTHGSLVGIPHRHAALIYPIENLNVVQAINTFMPVVKGMFNEGPGSLSDNILWYNNGKFTNLPYEIDGQKMSFIPPQDFVDMIQTLGK